ncbi:MAG: hypothetical protein EZS28_007276 [Streblomastix strix]|uniref:PPPDE domain-containing protein n=1 Tax=Streblomastix strix TaxID=222440 RepID=A0A5J4WRK6_9EUKA|nr:MAG: hypothetical protein EZS28_007276 [Streblomastix strix]
MTTSSNVILHVYDLSKGAARTMSKLFLGGKIEGIWHSGVVAFGYEYFYSTGIFREIPGKTPAGVPWKTIQSSTQHLERDIARMRIAPRNLLPSQTPILFASTAYLYEDLNVDRLMKRLLENADQMEKRLASESGHLIDNMGNSSLKTQFPFNQYSFPPPPVDSNFGRGQQFPFHNIQNNPFHNIQNNIQNGFLQGFQQGFLQGFQQPPHFIPPNPDNLQNNQSSQSNIGISQQNNFPFYHPNAYDPNQFMFNHLQNNQGLDSSNQFNNQKINVQSEQIKILHPGILTKEERTRINSLEVRIFLQQLVSGGVVPTIPGSTAINAQNTSASISTPNILTQNTGFNFNSIQQTNEGSESDSSDPFSSDEDDKQQKNINTNESMQQQRRSVRTRGWIYNSTSSGRGSKNSSGMIKDKNKNNNKNQNPDEDDGRNGIPKGLMSPLTRIRCTWKGPLLLPLLDMLRVLVLHPSGAEMVCRGCICSQQQEMSSYAPLSIIKLFHELAMSEEDDVLIKEIAKVEDAEWQLNNEEMGQSFCSCWMSILKQGNQNDSSKDPLNSLQKSSNQLPSDNIRLMCIRIAVNLFKTQLGSQFVSAGQHLSFFLAIAIRMINPYITIEEHKLICAQTLERIKYLSSMKNKQEKQQTKRNKQFSEMDKEDEINSSFDDEDNKDINERVIKDHLDLSGQMNMFGIQNENKSQSSSFQQQVQNHHHLPHREISQGEKFLQQGGACLIHNIALELGAHTHHIHNGEQINQENTVNGKQHSFGLSCIAVHALSQALKNEYDDIRQKQTQQFALPHGLVGRDVSAQINDDTLHTFLKALGVSCLDNCRASQEVGDAEVATLIQIRDSWHGKAEIRDLAAEICRILGV